MKTAALAQSLIASLHEVIGQASPPICLHEPSFGDGNERLVLDCLRSTYVSSVGKYVGEFEELVANYTGASTAIAVVNGTAGLHLSLVAIGVRPGDEVLVPSLSFVATANAVAHAGGSPHFIDVEEETLGINPTAIRFRLEEVARKTPTGPINRQTGNRIVAVVPMHAYGHPARMEDILAIAEEWGIAVVEDAAESLGSWRNGRHTGTFGRLGVISFNGNKVITTGGGGMIITNDLALGERLRKLSTTAKKPHPWRFFHDETAWNYRLPNLNAALGCAQMTTLDGKLKKKRLLADRYARAFAATTGFRFLPEPKGCQSNYWLCSVLAQVSGHDDLDCILKEANKAGYQCRPVWEPLHRLPMYENCPRTALPVTGRLAEALINLPSSPFLVSDE